jgi:hypothetical protein
LASSHQFRFSQKFIDEYLPYVIELVFNTDFFGNHRGTHVVPGPFAELSDEINVL